MHFSWLIQYSRKYMGPFKGDIFMKKEWTKPQLIVVARGLAQENVLIGCRVAGNSGASATDGGCLAQDSDGLCTACATSTNS
jgi:hypothetical protein